VTTLPAHETVGLQERSHFLLRRLHSLTGIVPIGAFLLEHLFTNVHAWYGPQRFNEAVHWLHNLPFLTVLEVCFIFLPLALHGVYGLIIAWGSSPNTLQYPYMANWRYRLQRIAGYLMFLFVIIHLAKFRFAHWFGGTPYIGSEDPFAITRHGLVAWQVFGVTVPAWLTLALYVVGLTATVYHFANGLWTFAISWGIAGGPVAQKWIGYVCAAVGLVLIAWGYLSLYAFVVQSS